MRVAETSEVLDRGLEAGGENADVCGKAGLTDLVGQAVPPARQVGRRHETDAVAHAEERGRRGMWVEQG